MAKSYKRGFTLIELLVVIAIIGLLAAVVLASLGSARSKGQDAAVKAQLSAIRTSMELFSSTGTQGYFGGCASTNVAAALTNALSSSAKGGTMTSTNATAGTWQNVTCHDGATTGSSAWAAEAPLSTSVSGTPSMWCVDSTGAAKVESGNLATLITACT